MYRPTPTLTLIPVSFQDSLRCGASCTLVKNYSSVLLCMSREKLAGLTYCRLRPQLMINKNRDSEQHQGAGLVGGGQGDGDYEQ